MLAIIKKELLVYFTTMTGYIYLAALILNFAYIFVMACVFGGYPDYSVVILSTISTFMILVPISTMRLFADESKQNTDQLLYTSPMSISKIVIAKFLGACALFLIGILITSTFPLIISNYGTVGFQKIMVVTLGYILLIFCFISIGVFISSITQNQIIAAAGTFGAIFFFMNADIIGQTLPTSRASSIVFFLLVSLLIAFILYDATKNWAITIGLFILECILIGVLFFVDPLLFDAAIYNVFLWFSPIYRFQDAAMGILNVSDMIYYITFIIAFIFLTVNTIEKRRWR